MILQTLEPPVAPVGLLRKLKTDLIAGQRVTGVFRVIPRTRPVMPPSSPNARVIGEIVQVTRVPPAGESLR